mmetsp:Transcript_24034/g.66840  ORF Transcript_24034/g.66840 Transcript_24034/m.66840 type:complete len:312 (+) Transcript_24034:186-1121(+)|eukprot:CAMPEP_0117475856 /NCGR_PEP_ID=MMETSP0784-20121206/10011_1 /TAXON_ID=39447 /ORGANISM="" /LENGTH=311 /DNA_ID=CAMNT_0005270117 /DNA_START=187 /DNA_END=1122 /DNA_ORIENTATION=+
MPHARKPKLQSPPGQTGPEVEERSVPHLAKKLDDLCVDLFQLSERVNMLEKVFIFVDIDQVNAALAATSPTQAFSQDKPAVWSDTLPKVSKPALPSCSAGVASRPDEEVFQPTDFEHFAADDRGQTFDDLFNALAGMAAHTHRSPGLANACQGRRFSTSSIPLGDCFEGDSMLMLRLQKQEQSAQLELRARMCGKTAESIGTFGTIDELSKQSLLTIGTLLESTKYFDVALRSFDGVRNVTAGPLIAVSDSFTYLDEQIVVLSDASPEPSRDRIGRAIFGSISRSSEVFCLVGHTQYGGQYVTFDELVASR